MRHVIAQNVKTLSLAANLMPNETFAERLEMARREKKLSKAELSRRSGVSRQTINWIVNGSKSGKVTPETLFSLADGLGIQARWLAFGTGARDAQHAFDVEMMAWLLEHAEISAEANGQHWTLRERIRFALTLYRNWEKTGARPDVEQIVQVLAAQNQEN